MKRLEDMTLQELWNMFPITLVAHDDRWHQWAAEEMEYIKSLVDDKLNIKIHHIGSTAIRSIMSKPIIDLLLETDIALFAQMKSYLLEAGYRCMNEKKQRISFNKGYTMAGYAEKVYHLHLRCYGDNDEICFRDYLCAHSDIARQYEALKLSLLTEHTYDRDAYTAAKSGFVRYYTECAKNALHTLEGQSI